MCILSGTLSNPTIQTEHLQPSPPPPAQFRSIQLLCPFFVSFILQTKGQTPPTIENAQTLIRPRSVVILMKWLFLNSKKHIAIPEGWPTLCFHSPIFFPFNTDAPHRLVLPLIPLQFYIPCVVVSIKIIFIQDSKGRDSSCRGRDVTHTHAHTHKLNFTQN